MSEVDIGPLFSWNPPKGPAAILAFPPARRRDRVEEYARKIADGRRNASRCLSVVKTHLRRELRQAGIAEHVIEREVARFDQAVRRRVVEIWALAEKARGPKHA